MKAISDKDLFRLALHVRLAREVTDRVASMYKSQEATLEIQNPEHIDFVQDVGCLTDFDHHLKAAEYHLNHLLPKEGKIHGNQRNSYPDSCKRESLATDESDLGDHWS